MTNRLIPVLAVTLVLIAAIVSITPWPVGAIQDDATYVILAKSLATGEGYRQLNLPDAPRVTHYPPGYPLFLAALWKLSPDFPNNVVLFKYVNAVLLAVAAAGVYGLARKRAELGAISSGVAAVAGLACVLVLYVTGVPLSEPLFLALLFPALMTAEAAVSEESLPLAVAAGALGGVLALVRTIGIALLPAVVLALIIKRRWSSAIAALATGLSVLAPWQLWATAHGADVPEIVAGKYGSYLSWMIGGYREGGWPFASAVVNKNIADLQHLLDYLVMPIASGWVRGATFACALALFVYGLTRLARRMPVTVLFVMGYSVIVLLWPFEVIRFVMAGFPLLAFVFIYGIVELWRARPPSLLLHAPRSLLLAGGAAVTIGFIWYNVKGYREQWWTSVQRDSGERIGSVVSWVRRNTSATDVVAVQDDPAVYLYTGRRAVPVNDFEATDHVRPSALDHDVANVTGILQRYRPRFYIVAWPNTLRAADSLARTRPAIIRPIDRIGSATVFMNLAQ
ncbi:MAG TPA: hypothetical protein VJ717_14320 [Gemmatimonadaceae bacterium]|nr:hypothetical protein [Gemmatimonadaceae bacterium]